MNADNSKIETKNLLKSIPPPEEVSFNKLNILNLYHKDDYLNKDSTPDDSVFLLNKNFELPSPLQKSNNSENESYDMLLSPPDQFKDVDDTDEGIYDNVPSEAPEALSVDSISLDTGTNTQSLSSHDNGSYENILNSDRNKKSLNQSLVCTNNKASVKNMNLKELDESCTENAPQKFPSEPNMLQTSCCHLQKSCIREVESAHNLNETQKFTYKLPLNDFNNSGKNFTFCL